MGRKLSAERIKRDSARDYTIPTIKKPGKVRYGDNVPNVSHALNGMRVGKLGVDGNIVYEQASVQTDSYIPDYSASNERRKRKRKALLEKAKDLNIPLTKAQLNHQTKIASAIYQHLKSKGAEEVTPKVRIKRVRINTYDGVKAAAYRYGISVEEVMALRDGGCEICGATANTRVMCIDHDHDTEEVRGCLCLQCNAAIGLLMDNSSVATCAANYLERNGK